MDVQNKKKENLIAINNWCKELDIDDYIIRVFNDPDVSQPIILVVKVTELLGTFNQEMLLWEKCICTPDNEALPDKILNIIGEMARRRLHIKF